MSRTRQTGFIACPPQAHPVSTLTYDFANDHEIPVHTHPEDQLVYASRGIMTVRTDQGTWVVPPLRAVWIPAKTPHGVIIAAPVSMRTVYLKRGLVRGLTGCRVVNVSPLLKELIVHACRFPGLTRRNKEHAHLIDVLVDQLEIVETAPLQLTAPADPRAVRIAEILTTNPADPRPLEEICKSAGASKRTIERLFQSETNMSLGEWRQQLRLVQSLRMLAAGEKIAHVAIESGYNSASAFIAMFKKALGKTPRQYFA